MTEATHDPTNSTLPWVELAEWLRSTETLLLHGQALLLGIDPDIAATTSVEIAPDAAAEARALCEQILESADALRALTATLDGSTGLEVRWSNLEREASTTLALGVADTSRVLLLAECVSVRAGFRALADMLRCTDYHTFWEDLTIGDVLGSFRGADAHFVRRITAQASLSPATPFAACDRDQLTRLATVLDEHAATKRRR